MRYALPIYRPPSERDSLLLQVTIGCSHPSCKFCFVSQQRDKLRIRSLQDIKQDIDEAAAMLKGNAEKLFLLAGDPSVLRAGFLCEIAEYAHARLPRLRTISMYAHPMHLFRKSPEELASMKRAGIDKLYIGIESGNAEVLRYMRKGVTPAQIIAAFRKAHDAGFTLSAQIIIGLGGKKWSRAHATDTAKVLSLASPHFVGALSLLIYPGTTLGKEVAAGTFVPLSPSETLAELEILIDKVRIKSQCVFRANHPSNLLPLGGTLPQDRDKLIALVRKSMRTKSGRRSEIALGL